MRQFLAVELPVAVRDEVERVHGELRGRVRGWRWVRPGSIHLTLRFLGEVGEDRDAPGRIAWRAAAAAVRPFEIRVTEIGTFPPSGRQRVLWIGVEETRPGGVLRRLAASLESEARALGFEPEDRELRPHLTLARARRGTRPQVPGEIRIEPAEGSVDEIVLFRSELLTDGARYTALERCRLGPPSDGERAG